MFLHHYIRSSSRNISPSVRWNLRAVCYTLTADGKYPVQHCGNFKLPIQCNYLKSEMAFLNFLFHFLNLHQILNILKKGMIVIGNAFLKLQTVKILVRPLSKKRRFRTRFDSQHVKASQILAKSPWECFYHVFSSFSGNFICKMSPLVLGEFLDVFINRLTADTRYPFQDCENLLLPFHMQLPEKPKAFSQLFDPFLESTSNFKHFERKDVRHSECVSEITDWEKLA